MLIFTRKARESRDARLSRKPSDADQPFSREAFFGGRTENIVTRYEVTGTEKIRYVNVYSLYPYVLKTSTFPLGLLFISENSIRS